MISAQPARPTGPRRFRTIAYAGLGVAIMLPIAACTVGGSSSDTGSGSDKGTLVVEEWTNPGAIDATKKIDALFEKQHPGVKVKLQNAPTANNAWQTLTNSMLAAKSVDVLAQFAPTQAGFPPSYTNLKPSGTASLITSGQLTDLSKQPFMKNYDKASQVNAVGYKNGIYGIMVAEYAHNGGLWYKKDLLAKYHMKVPTTFSEFMADLKTFKSHGISPIFVAGKDNLQLTIWNGIEFQMLMQGHPSSDQSTVSADRQHAFWNGKQNWDDALYKQVGQEYEQVMKYIEPSAGGVTEYTAPGIWAAKSDDFPFLVDGSYDYASISQANPKLNVGFFTLPGTNNAAANRVVLAPDLTWTVPSWAKHKKLAMEWLALFSQKANYQSWLKATGSLSTQPGVTAGASQTWTDWLNAHMSTAFPDLVNPPVPTGAATEAGGPDLTKLKPIGKQDVDTALSASAKAYSKATKK
jgi:raffinose/stachyose/melibiose transport system substrate-binding protein